LRAQMLAGADGTYFVPRLILVHIEADQLVAPDDRLDAAELVAVVEGDVPEGRRGRRNDLSPSSASLTEREHQFDSFNRMRDWLVRYM
jgi:hypothetical protein